MPRTGRIVLPHYPHHVIQRGHNRAPVFVHDADYDFYLDTLAEWKATFDVRVFAFCLMTNHVHLVLDPGENPGSLALLMKRIAGRYTRHVNRIENRTGTAWNGRFKSSPIETDRYLWACCRYVELNPVRAGIVAVAEEYPWSSYRDKIGQRRYPWLDEDPCYRALDASRRVREMRYRRWFETSIPEGEWEVVRQAVQRGQLTGGDRFRELVQQRLDRRVDARGRGRPKK